MRSSTINRSFESLYKSVNTLCDEAKIDGLGSHESFKPGDPIYDDEIAKRIENCAALVDMARRKLRLPEQFCWEHDTPGPSSTEE